MIDGIIYDKETVVCSTECLYFNRRILSIMTLQILTEYSAYSWREDSDRHSGLVFLPSDSVVKKSLTTEWLSSSPFLKILLTWIPAAYPVAPQSVSSSEK